MYLKGGHFDLAAQLAEEMGDLSAASRYYAKAGDLKAAGEMLLQLGKHEAAARLFGRAGQHIKAGEIFESLDQFDAAAEQFEQASFHEKAAFLYSKAGNYRRAATLLEGLIASTGKDEFGASPSESEKSQVLKYHRHCGELLLRGDQPERAANHFEAALCLEQAAEAWRLAGKVDQAVDILLRLQKPEEALALLQGAGKDLSCLSPAVQAAILTGSGRHREAAEVLQLAGSNYSAAEALARAGDHDRAATMFEKERDLEQAAIQYTRAGKYVDAARILEASRDYGQAAKLYQKAGCPEDAARVLLKGGDPVAAAMIHYDRRDFDAVIKALQTVRSDQSGYRKASFLLGRVFADQGLYTLAVDKFHAAIDGRDVDEETLLFHYSLARAHEANRRPREALDIYRKILSFDYHYKDVLDRMRAAEGQAVSQAASSSPQPAAASQDEQSESKRYRIEKSLGTGTRGEVFLATDMVLERPVALCRLHEAPEERGKAARFLKSAAANARLNHPNIITTFDRGIDDEGSFIVTALAQGRTLRALLDQKVRFEANRIVDIGRQILQALDHAHGQGILHRNLAPESIFVTDDDRVSVSDFGLAVRLSDLSSEDLASGPRIQYTPPEILLRERVDERSDLYSFGILLYEMAVGHPPFRGNAVGHQHVNAPVPAPGPGKRPLQSFLKKVILRCLEKNRDDRYPSVKAVLEDLEIKDIVPGMIVAERYEVLAEVGRGGMGTVFRARDVELDETVALKFLRGETSSEMAARQVRETKIARSVLHPNVVRVFTLDKWGEHRFIVMEYIDGVTLPRWLERAPTPTLKDRLQIAIQAARALDAAHGAGIIHRDIKPENILITNSGETKVLDFGIAQPETDEHTATSAGIVLGSPMYLAPERIQGKSVDRRSDIYALGAVLYFLFTGRHAFAGNDAREILMKHLHSRPVPPDEIDASLPRPISDTILRALHPDLNRRFSSAADVADALAGVLEKAVA